MTFAQVMAELKKLGTAQNVKTYKRHGMSEPLFGVSFANLSLLQKRIKVDHDLAVELWKSGNGDARHLATMIADPAKFTAKELDEWVKDQGSYGVCNLLSGLVGKTKFAQEKAEKWLKSSDEWIGSTGWGLIGVLALDSAVTLPDSYFEAWLQRIETTIHSSKNFTRYYMNMALIAIGIRNAKLKKLAQAAAKRIGKVEVDHGETSCKTPDAFAYIEKSFARHQAKLEKAVTKGQAVAKSRVQPAAKQIAKPAARTLARSKA